MFNTFLKKSSKLLAVVLAVTLSFSSLSYATPATGFTQFQTLVSDGTAVITVNNIEADQTETDKEPVRQGSNNLTITNSEGVTNGVIDAGGQNHNNAGFIMGTGQTTTIENIFFKNFYKRDSGSNNYGSVIYNDKGTLTISGSTFDGNHAKTSGGAIYNLGNLTISNTNFSTNTVKGTNGDTGGGAIHSAHNSTTTITGSGEYSYNHADSFGGAIYNGGYMMTIGDETNVITFSSNTTGSNGGALYNFTGSTMIISSGTKFIANSSQKGGAISDDGHMTIGDNVEFSFNTATKNSGAIGVWSKSNKPNELATLNIGNDIKFYSNKALGSDNDSGGGALYNKQYATTTIGDRAIFSSNTATKYGGAVYNISSLTIGDNAEFLYNEANEAGAIYNKNGGTVTIGKGVKFSSNAAERYGGAIENTGNSKMYIGTNDNTKTEFSYNTAERAGAVNNYSNSTIEFGNNVDFLVNISTYAGGAVFNETNSKISMGDNINFSNNEVLVGFQSSYIYGGGAIWNNHNSTIDIGNNVSFSSNTSAKAGGAISNVDNSKINITGNNISFTSNAASTFGGAIYNENSSVTLGNEVRFTSNTANTSGGAIYSKGGTVNSVITIGNNAEFKYNEATDGGAIYNLTGSTITIKDGSQFKENTASTNGGAIYNSGIINIGTSTFVDNTSNGQKIDIYNIGNLVFTAETTSDDKTTTMTGGITNGGIRQGTTTIKKDVTLMVGFDENKQALPATENDSATFIQNNVILEENAIWHINVYLNENNFKITDKVTSQQGAKIYIDGNGDLSWNTEGLGEYHYNGNINIIGNTLEHDTMYIGDNEFANTVRREGTDYTTTVNNIQGANATLVNKGTLNLNLSSQDEYNLKTLTNETETETGIFNINVKDNVTLDLSNKTIQQKETTVSGDGSKYLILQNAQLNSDLVNNLGGEGLTLQNSTVEGQLTNQNHGQITLEQNSQINGQITNDRGTINILDDFTIQNGITSNFPIEQNIVNIGNASASKNATVTSSTTIQDQTINISSGSLTMSNAGDDGSISSSYITVTEYGQLVANAGKLTNIINGIQNSGIVEFIGGTNDNNISGPGELIINGDVSNNTGRSISQKAITINENKSFTTNATDITTDADYGISNAGALTFTGGTNTNKISGDGNLTITGQVTNSTGKINQSSITVTEDSSFRVYDAGDITTGDEGIGNEGTLQFDGGVNTSTITGNGNLLINGTVENAEGTKIEQSEVRVLSDKNLIANASDINAPSFGIVNAGTVTFTGGTNNNEISGSNGRLEITGEVTNDANITQKEVVINTTGDLTNNEGKIITARELTNSGILTSNADDIVISGTDKKITNSGTYNITGGTISGYNVTGTSIDSSKVNILGDVTIASGKTITNNTVTLGNGTDEATLKLGKDDNLTGSTLIITNGTILITDNGTAGDIAGTVRIEDGAQWDYQLDVDLEHIETIGGNDFGVADNLNVAEDGVGEGSKATITSIHLNKDKSTKTTVQIANRDINAEVAGNVVIYTTNFRYIVTSRVDADGHTVLDIEAAGYGGLQGAVYEGASSYSVTGDEDFLTAWIVEGTKTYDTLKANLHIKGFENVLTSSTSASGIKTSSYTLTVTDLQEYSGFENAITVQRIGEETGTLNVSSVTFRDNSGLAVIINAGTTNLTNVTFEQNSADVDILNNRILNIKAEGEDKTTTLEKGISGTGTTTIENGAELINGEASTIIQSSMTIA